MNGQWGSCHVEKKRDLYECKVGLLGCKVDHQSLFLPRKETNLTPPPPPPQIVLSPQV